MKYDVALLIGRFQPFHLGHLYLLKKASEMADKIVVGIGSANITDVNNPLDFEIRKKIIKAVVYKEKLDGRVEIVALDDFFDDEKWLKNVYGKVGQFEVVIGNNEWVNGIMERAGIKVKKFPYFKRFLYEGWRIRKLMGEKKKWENRVPKYIIKFLSTHYPLPTTHFEHVAVGGTFDHFHKGHKALLDKAASIGKRITIGLATEKLFIHKAFSETIEPYGIRKKNLERYLGRGRDLDIVPLNDIYGPTVSQTAIDAIVVSRQTLKNALKINGERAKKSLKPMQIVVVENVLAGDGEMISSERIRGGEIDREGTVYSDYFKKTLVMPESLKKDLRKPLGRVFGNTKSLLHYINKMEWTLRITVGDIIAKSLIEKRIYPEINIIDFKTRREKFSISNFQFSKDFQISKYKFPNLPGTINSKTTEKLGKLIRSSSRKLPTTDYSLSANSWLVVNGEEDLLALPAILLAPLGSLVLYGHWQLGVIAVEIDEEIKFTVTKLIQKFTHLVK